MKIGIPGNINKPSKTKTINSPNISESKPIWKIIDGYSTSIINKKIIKIDLITFDIYLPNGFKIGNNKTMEDAIKKCITFFS